MELLQLSPKSKGIIFLSNLPYKHHNPEHSNTILRCSLKGSLSQKWKAVPGQFLCVLMYLCSAVNLAQFSDVLMTEQNLHTGSIKCKQFHNFYSCTLFTCEMKTSGLISVCFLIYTRHICCFGPLSKNCKGSFQFHQYTDQGHGLSTHGDPQWYPLTVLIILQKGGTLFQMFAFGFLVGTA